MKIIVAFLLTFTSISTATAQLYDNGLRVSNQREIIELLEENNELLRALSYSAAEQAAAIRELQAAPPTPVPPRPPYLMTKETALQVFGETAPYCAGDFQTECWMAATDICQRAGGYKYWVSFRIEEAELNGISGFLISSILCSDVNPDAPSIH
ncbi:MAG: hypothetical protein AAFR39_04460 [Pseudomonadota bacterium]